MRGIIYHPVTLVQAIHHIILSRASNSSQDLITVIICCNRDGFEAQLAHCIVHQLRTRNEPPLQAPLPLHSLATLLSSSSIKLAFCDSTAALHAYLSALRRPGMSDLGIALSDVDQSLGDRSSRLFILKPLALHRESASYSAQGLGDTFAAALDAAWRTNQILVIFEPQDIGTSAAHPSKIQNWQPQYQHEVRQGEEEDSDACRQREPHEDPWDAELPIVNSSTRNFGSSADRARMLRTTKVRVVAARWCMFRSLPHTS